MKMHREAWVGWTALALAAVVFTGERATAARAAETRPNVVLILADDLGCETLGCYGGTSYRTPNVDRLAATGMRFRHGYSMPVCHPTRTTILTGRYPFQMGTPGWGRTINGLPGCRVRTRPS